MILLDTNVVSELLKPRPDSGVVRWSKQLETEQVAVSVVTVFEIRRGLALLDEGRRKHGLKMLFSEFLREHVGALLPFDREAAENAAKYAAERQRMGRPIVDLADVMIAGIALCLPGMFDGETLLATRNTGDFVGLNLVNPWDA